MHDASITPVRWCVPVLLLLAGIFQALTSRAGEPTGWTTGGKSVLIIPVGFTDAAAPTGPAAGWSNLMADVNAFYLSQSYGKLWISQATVAAPVAMGVSSTNYRPYVDWRTTALLPDVRAKAKLAGYDTSAYDLEIIHTYLTNEPSGGGAAGAGVAMHGGKGCWLNYSNNAAKIIGATPHEIGHNLGAFHCTGFSCASLFYPMKTGVWADEYGGYFDRMGSGEGPHADFCAYYKNFMGWLPDSMVAQASSSGTYRIHAFDQGAVAVGSHYALKIQRDQGNTYWFEFRQADTGSVWSMNGLAVYNGGEYVLSSARAPRHLDMTPGSHGPYFTSDPVKNAIASQADATLLLGRTFSDANRDLHVTPLRKGGTTPESLDVVVAFGPFPGNQPPAVSLSASTLTPSTNQAVTFTATVSDPDGDPLAYFWEFDDPDAPAAAGIRPFGSGVPHPDATFRATATNAWLSNGVHLARCTVTDMKGGRTIATIPVTVGGGGGLVIRGVVKDEAGNPIPGAIVNNWRTGSPPTQYGTTGLVASGETSSNGEYVIRAQSNTTYRLLARHQGRSFVCGIPGGSETGTVFVGSTSVTNVDFTRTNLLCTIGGTVYLAGIGRAYHPATDGPMTVHDGIPAHDVLVDSNGAWRMTVPQGPLALSFTTQPGHTLAYGFLNPLEVLENTAILHTFVDIPGAVANVGFASAHASGPGTAGAVDIPIVLTPPLGFTNTIWPPGSWLACEVDASSTARYGIDYRMLGMEVRFTNNTSSFTTHVTLDVLPPGVAASSRVVVLRLEPLNSATHMGSNTTFRYALIPPGADADADGLPDAWEWQHAGDLTNLHAAADTDGDSVVNADEYAADTDPASAASVLRLTDLHAVPGGISVGWQGGRQAWQFLEVSSPTGGPWTAVFTNPPVTALATNRIHPADPSAALHYRIRAVR